MREKFKKGEIVSATRTFNGEIITGEFRGYHLFNDEIPDTVVGVVHVPGDGVYDVDVTSIRRHENKDERIRKELIEFIQWSEDRGMTRHDFHQAKRPSEWIAYLEKQKEQKPILEVFGFKVGDAVRLKDGDGRKHTIKSFEEVEGVHGPNFYHVEFEDNSARDGIYPGEEYPNGYYTQMEKFEEEHKPAGYCSVRDEFDLDGNLKQKSAEWSEEDEKHINLILRVLDIQQCWDGATGKKFNPYQDEIDWLKSLRPRPSWKPSEEQMRCFDRALALCYETMDENLYNVLVQLREKLNSL